MEKGNKSTGLWRGLSAVIASMCAVTVAGTFIAYNNGATINAFLGTSNYRVEKVSGKNTTDGIYFDSEFKTVEELIAAKDKLAEQISAEGSVLLKNHNAALPLNKTSEHVTLWGMNSHTPTLGGMIGSSVTPAVKQGQKAYDIESALREKGFTLNEDMISLYSSDEAMSYARRGFGQTGHGLTPSFAPTYAEPDTYQVGEIPANLYSDATLSSADQSVAIVVISRDNTEAADYEPNMKNGTKGDTFERPLALSKYERDMIALAKQHSTKVVVLLNSDNPLEISDLKNDSDIDAILWAGAPGMSGFLGVADVLSGDANPSGRLVDTYAVNSTSTPAMVNWGLYLYSNSTKSTAKAKLTQENKADWYLVESEGIYNGYRYYETRYEDSVLGQGQADSNLGSSDGSAWKYASEVSYPFGYGLSYTTFEQKLKSVDVKIGSEESQATIEVTNTGKTAGKSVVELYAQTPYNGNLEKAAIQLMGIGKTGELKPGETTSVDVTFRTEDMASYDQAHKNANGSQGAWVLSKGDYRFAIGNGVHEALNNILAEKRGSKDKLVTINDEENIDASKVAKFALNKEDSTTYSKNVQNALQNMDINNLIPNTVEYTTRADWTKGWKPLKELTPTQEMMVGLTNSNSKLTKNGEAVTWGQGAGLTIAGMINTDKDGNFKSVADLNDPMWDKLVDQISLDEAINFIEKQGDGSEAIRSIALSGGYLPDGPVGITYDQVEGYSAQWSKENASEPTYVGPDSKYAKWSMTWAPTEPVVASTYNTELVEREGELLGEDNLWSNTFATQAPGLNLHRNAYNARNHEYFSEDPVLTSTMGTAYSRGGTSKGSIMVPKHFAFNHQETNRSGLSTFMTEQAAREGELRGFRNTLASGAATGLMTSFNRAGTVFAGAHEGLLKQILRNEWKYQGAVYTDMINGADYMNWRDVVFAGGGNLLTTSAYDTSKIGTMAASKSSIKKDMNFQKEMKQNLKYWLHTLAGSSAMNGLTSDMRIVYQVTWWQWCLYAACGLCAVLTILSVVKWARAVRKPAVAGKDK
ncbi:glycoside hydrolase family 3 C-terminal domain-containing protein [Alloscardovia omnicolens]|uniref:glycoside hydrolase family 3 protein n=1 Tax=Alloscardovia omnicolens TaxID=419015 RepID=UPI003A5DE443